MSNNKPLNNAGTGVNDINSILRSDCVDEINSRLNNDSMVSAYHPDIKEERPTTTPVVRAVVLSEIMKNS